MDLETIFPFHRTKRRWVGRNGYGVRQNTTSFPGGRDFWPRNLPGSPQVSAWPWRSGMELATTGRSNVPDMIAYVATKNLLIGAGLFGVLYLLGVLPGTAS